MKKGLTVKDITPGMKSSVRAYLMSRAYAETVREAIDKAYVKVLKDFPIYEDLDIRGISGDRIVTEKTMYLSTDKKTCKAIYDEIDSELRKAGLKPDDMPDDHCPALVAEEIQRQAERLVIETTAEMLGEEDFLHRLICHGIDKYREFIELVTKMIVNMPNFALKI